MPWPYNRRVAIATSHCEWQQTMALIVELPGGRKSSCKALLNGSDRSSRPCWWTHGNMSYATNNSHLFALKQRNMDWAPEHPGAAAMKIEKHMQALSDKPLIYIYPPKPKTLIYRTCCKMISKTGHNIYIYTYIYYTLYYIICSII